MFALTSCSILDPEPGTSLEVSEFTKHNKGNWNFHLIQRKPFVYESSKPPHLTDIPLYLTVISDCHFNTEHTSIPSITRQLFIGLKDLRIKQQGQLVLADNTVTRWIVTAKLEDQALAIATYSLQDKSCVNDFVLWSFGIASPEKLAAFTATVRSFADYLATKLPELSKQGLAKSAELDVFGES